MAANDYTRTISITPLSATYAWGTPPSWITITRIGTSNDWKITIATNTSSYRTAILSVTHSNGVTTDTMNVIQEGASAAPTATPVPATATPVPPPTATLQPLTFSLYSSSGSSISTGRSYTWNLSGYPQTGHIIRMGIYSTTISYFITATDVYGLSYDGIGAAYAAFLNNVTAAQWKAAGVTSYAAYTQGNPVGFEPTASYDAVNNRLTFNMNYVNSILPPYTEGQI